MKLFDKVAIVGTGLIGGSIALALKNKRLARQIVGVSRHKKSLQLAKRMGVIDKGSLDIASVKDADLIILATPVSAILNFAPRISKIAAPGCIVTDVGSTKEEIVLKLSKIFPRYLGAHPLAGSEKRGVRNVNSGLFKKSLCILTPLKDTDEDALRKIKKMWMQIGAKVVLLTPQAHDKILSYVSHLPHIVAFSLANTVNKNYFRFASTGFKDTTRIAASDSGLWTDIFLSNRKNMLKVIGSLQGKIKKIKTAIERNDRKTLNKILKKAKVKRDSLNC